MGLKAKIQFDGCSGPTGQLYDLQLGLYNLTDEDVTIDWDASSLQLPGDRQWHVVRPEVAGGEDSWTTVVLARSAVTVRVCPNRARTSIGRCDQSWLHPVLFSDGSSLTLRPATLTVHGSRTGEWVWDFTYHEEGRSGGEFASELGVLPVVLLVAAAVILTLILLL